MLVCFCEARLCFTLLGKHKHLTIKTKEKGSKPQMHDRVRMDSLTVEVVSISAGLATNKKSSFMSHQQTQINGSPL